MKKIIIVEDDKHKLNEILNFVNHLGYKSLDIADNVQDAIALANDKEFDLYILDNSLPSHSTKESSGAAISMTSGAIEILMELYCLEIFDKSIFILTQFPYLEIEDEMLDHKKAEERLKMYLGFNTVSVVNYLTDNWKEKLKKEFK